LFPGITLRGIKDRSSRAYSSMLFNSSRKAKALKNRPSLMKAKRGNICYSLAFRKSSIRTLCDCCRCVQAKCLPKLVWCFIPSVPARDMSRHSSVSPSLRLRLRETAELAFFLMPCSALSTYSSTRKQPQEFTKIGLVKCSFY
jgi:hypothetical protein